MPVPLIACTAHDDPTVHADAHVADARVLRAAGSMLVSSLSILCLGTLRLMYLLAWLLPRVALVFSTSQPNAQGVAAPGHKTATAAGRGFAALNTSQARPRLQCILSRSLRSADHDASCALLRSASKSSCNAVLAVLS
jgi:hypothetical protein